MTFKDKVIKYLEDFIDDKFCDYATGRDIRVFVLPHIKFMQEDPVSDDLEEAVNAYIGYAPEVDECSSVYGKRQAFKAGAQWQKQQFEKNRLEHCDSITEKQYNLEVGFIDSHIDKYNRMPTFLDAIEYGMEKMKEQMMKDAVECDVSGHGTGWLYFGQVPECDYDFNRGDKAKVIIFKED